MKYSLDQFCEDASQVLNQLASDFGFLLFIALIAFLFFGFDSCMSMF
jgi:hypothetical protein